MLGSGPASLGVGLGVQRAVHWPEASQLESWPDVASQQNTV